MLPTAKLMTRLERYTSTMPIATSAVIRPPTTPLNSRFQVTIGGEASSAALGPEEHRPGEVVRVRGAPRSMPSNRTSPFSRKMARSAIASATFSDCSTMIIVWPRALSSSTTSSRRCTTSGARPSESSSIIRSSGSWISTRPSASICCWPPDRLLASCFAVPGELGEQLVDAGDPLRAPRLAALGVEPRAHRQVLVDGEVAGTRRCRRELHDAEVLARASGDDVRDVAGR